MEIPFGNAQLEAKFRTYPPEVRKPLLKVLDLIFTTASEMDAVGEIIETLKWGQPAFLPAHPKIGTTIRIDAVKEEPEHYAVFFHYQTTLVSTFRQLYPNDFTFQGNRALIFTVGHDFPVDPFRHCVAMALTYHKQHAR
ncbi:DUF1801 domain-containing protein [Microvirga sp. 2MCAF35]|uniref:DUF1801 domain-containing protein n=1 Tax=Microvirga sp. 2MCAF35 TaxID=3232987 RepID=UPI003F9A3B7E